MTSAASSTKVESKRKEIKETVEGMKLRKANTGLAFSFIHVLVPLCAAWDLCRCVVTICGVLFSESSHFKMACVGHGLADRLLLSVIWKTIFGRSFVCRMNAEPPMETCLSHQLLDAILRQIPV